MCLASTLLLPAFSHAAPPGSLSSWTQTFGEEFNGTSLDTSKWNTGYGWGRVTDWSLEYSAPENVSVSDGACHLKVERRAQGGRSFSSGGINTKNKFAQQYGYFEARLKVAKGQSFLNAFWGKRNDESWPPEIDITEVLGRDVTRTFKTVHYDADHKKNGSSWVGPDFSAGFHTFGVDWGATQSIFYVDGIERFRTTAGAGSINGPFYWMLNIHVGGDWAGAPDSTTPGSAVMDVDWVRAWKRNSSSQGTVNLASNPGFEASGATQTPSGWSEWSDIYGAGASYSETAGNHHGGAAHATHYATSAYRVYTFQTKTNLADGLYTLRAWVKSSGGQKTARLEAKDYGGTLRAVTFPQTSTWTQIELRDIAVSGGNCTFGVLSDASGGQWLNFDDVDFFRQ